MIHLKWQGTQWNQPWKTQKGMAKAIESHLHRPASSNCRPVNHGHVQKGDLVPGCVRQSYINRLRPPKNKSHMLTKPSKQLPTCHGQDTLLLGAETIVTSYRVFSTAKGTYDGNRETNTFCERSVSLLAPKCVSGQHTCSINEEYIIHV